MKNIILLAALILAPLAGLHAAANPKPNIILIFADDLGWKDVGYQGSDFMETPNIDRMAKQGMVFSAGYAGAGNCAPSRACLLSGTYTPRHGVYAVGSTDRGPRKSQRLIPIPNKSGLARENITIADALKSAGYVTGIFGKWHLNGKDGAEPGEQGFDEVFQSNGGWSKKEPANPNGIYSLTKAAGEFMEKNKDRPFFLYLPHYAIHTGLQARASTLEKFKAKKPGAQHSNALYAACTYDLDDGIGLLLKKLADLGLEENTLVVFTSDNGGTQQSSQEPLRGNKGGYYEGGIREPFIVRWPGVTKPGSRCDVPVINVDLFPTFLSAAGVAVPAGKTLDGESLVPLFKGEGALKRQSIFWHFPGYLDDPVIRGRELDVRTGFRSRPVTVIHKGDWKLHLFLEEWQLDGGRAKLAENHAVELYNLNDDIGERNDLANKNTAKRDELLDELLAWQKSVNALLPGQPNPDYVPTATTEGRSIKNKAPKRSNILFLFADDWAWPHASCLGCPGVRTPAFDRIAKEGVLFRNAHAAAPSCSPSRASILSGQWPWRLEEGANLWSIIPPKFEVYPDLLEQAGYFVGKTGKGYGPGNDKGRPHNAAGPDFKNFDAFLAARPKEKPFCFWFGSGQPHRAYVRDSGVKRGLDPAKVVVPPYLPDNEVIRRDICDYFAAAEDFDSQVAGILAALEKAGELDNTLIAISGDNGWPFPRSKATCYDTGTHQPLAIRWGGHLKPGRVVDDFVSLSDLAPTFLEAAGLKPPAAMTARSFLNVLLADQSGQIAPARDHVLTGMERHASPGRSDGDLHSVGYPMRTILTKEFHYIRNFRPGRWPTGDPPSGAALQPEALLKDTYAGFCDVDAGPSKAWLLTHGDEPAVKPFYDRAFGKRPARELYDLRSDPYELKNVADDPVYANTIKNLDDRLMTELKATADPRATGGGDEFDRYPSTRQKEKSK